MVLRLKKQLQFTALAHNVAAYSVTFLGRLFGKVNLIKPFSNVHPCVRLYVHPSTKSFFDFNEIWHVCRGWWLMHNSMQYDPIQGQVHEPFKVGYPAISKAISSVIYNWCWQLHLSFTPGLKPTSFTNPTPRSFTSSSWTASMDFCLHRFFWATRFLFFRFWAVR